MTMRIIKPTTLTDAMLTSSTAIETAPAAYSAGTTYALGDQCSVAGAAGLLTVYQSLQASNTGHTPASSPTWWAALCITYQVYSGSATYALGDKVISTTTHRIYEAIQGANTGHALTDILWWLDIAPTNKWAMFDQKVGTTTTLSLSPLTVVMQPGAVGGLALMELAGQQATITMKDAPGGTTVYSATVSLDGTIILSIYDWFFEDYTQLSDLVLTNLPPHFTSCEITIALTSSSGAVSCGVCHAGKVAEIGLTEYGATAGITSYSVKQADVFGNIDVVPRANSKRNTLKIVTEKSDFNRIYRLLAAMDSTPCIYIATEAPGYEPLIAYGFWRDFSIDVSYPTIHLCNIEIEGLI